MPTIWKLKGAIVRLLCPLFFERIGSKTQFTGRIRWPMPFRRIELGRSCMVGHDVFFQTSRTSKISIGDDVSLNTGTHIVASAAITIGDRVAVGEYVTIRDQDHGFTPDTGVRGQGFKIEPVVIGKNTWIGRGVHIGPGVTIGEGCIIAANAVVRGQFPDNVLIAGVPATIKRRIARDGSTLPYDQHTE